MSWELKKLDEIVLVKSGKRLPKGHSFIIKPTNHPYIRARDIKNGKINVEAPVYINDDTFNKISKYTVSENDVVITIVGANVGDIAIIDAKYSGANLTENAAKLIPKNNNELSPKFLKYSLFGDTQKSKFQQIAMAAAQPKLGFYKIKDFEINVPNIQTQKRIADILSAYDDLIENNLKRIKLLEQAAQNIYKEWFVKLRFPGHENTPINEETGLPEEWTERNINKVFNIKYGKNLPATKITSSGKHPVYGASGVMGYYEECNTEIKVALITSRGNGSGDVHRTFQKNTFVTNNSFKVFPKEGYEFYPFFFVTEFLKTLNLLNYCSGSAQPQLTNASMNNIRSIFPNKEIVALFTQKVSPFLEQSDILLKQNQKLKAARDILLPRLMNRTIEV